ncbi:MAG TPA: hypothetical protein VJS92_15415 [Candidatus Polarisedimenticolaceae bacterium]|nr:hypothetical protein [Candidatus Polarisedimenticolaceae bacterium]
MQQRLGARAAAAVFALSLAYIAIGAAGLASGGLADPWLAILEALIIAAAPCMVITLAARRKSAPTRGSRWRW